VTSGGQILLLDVLDSTGADFTDVRDRTALLRDAGARVTALAIGTNLDPEAKGLGRGSLVAEPGTPSLRAARVLATSGSFDLAIVASAAPQGGPLGRSLPASLPLAWWPTGLPRGASWLGRLARSLGGREVSMMFASAADPKSPTVPALAGSFVEAPASRRATLPLWDGDIVLAPEGFGEPHGPLAWAAFAALAETWTELDLVTWSHPRPADDALNRRFGAGARIHQVGPPPRMAEWAWWTQARAVLLTGSGPISGGLALRALAAGCPILFVGEEGAFGGLASDLRRRGCAWHAVPDARVVTDELSRLLARGPNVTTAVERGRILAAHHDRSALAARVSAALAPLSPPGDVAAA
jgi:hypothetical protein